MRLGSPPPTFNELLSESATVAQALGPDAPRELGDYVRHANDAYWTWDELQRRPAPSGITHRSGWLATKLARRMTSQPLELQDQHGQPFWFGIHPWMLRILNNVDLGLGGTIADASADLGSPDRERYLIRSLMEEGIASSQIEGAAVTREEAKQMLKTGRKPLTHDERMVLNNYRTIRWVREHKNEPLSKELLFDIHRRITEGTLEKPDASGRFRSSNERVRVVDERDNEVIHEPPPAEELDTRFDRLSALANSTGGAKEFLHPVIRAIILHFMLAYDHPFVDGNGRTARALFYWSMLRAGYWLFEFLSISRIVTMAPVQYVRAFVSTETDEGDLTYFLRYHLRVIERAREELHHYLDAQRSRNAEMTLLLRAHSDLNHRQRALLIHAIHHANAVYSIESHRGSHSVRYDTARLDLADLARRGLLLEYKTGRRLDYSAPHDLAKLLSAPRKRQGSNRRGKE